MVKDGRWAHFLKHISTLLRVRHKASKHTIFGGVTARLPLWERWIFQEDSKAKPGKWPPARDDISQITREAMLDGHEINVHEGYSGHL